MCGHKWRHPGETCVPATGKRDMGMEPAGLRRQSGTLTGSFDPRLEPGQNLVPRNPGPQGAHLPPGVELPDVGELNLERITGNPGQRVVHIFCDTFGDLADEPQCQMHVLGRHPVRAGHLAPQTRQAQPQICGQVERDKEPNQWGASATSGKTVRTPV